MDDSLLTHIGWRSRSCHFSWRRPRCWRSPGSWSWARRWPNGFFWSFLWTIVWTDWAALAIRKVGSDRAVQRRTDNTCHTNYTLEINNKNLLRFIADMQVSFQTSSIELSKNIHPLMPSRSKGELKYFVMTVHISLDKCFSTFLCSRYPSSFKKIGGTSPGLKLIICGTLCSETSKKAVISNMAAPCLGITGLDTKNHNIKQGGS
jgi:hypothetical protein